MQRRKYRTGSPDREGRQAQHTNRVGNCWKSTKKNNSATPNTAIKLYKTSKPQQGGQKADLEQPHKRFLGLVGLQQALAYVAQRRDVTEGRVVHGYGGVVARVAGHGWRQPSCRQILIEPAGTSAENPGSYPELAALVLLPPAAMDGHVCMQNAKRAKLKGSGSHDIELQRSDGLMDADPRPSPTTGFAFFPPASSSLLCLFTANAGSGHAGCLLSPLLDHYPPAS